MKTAVYSNERKTERLWKQGQAKKKHKLVFPASLE